MSCMIISDDHINALVSWAQWNSVMFRVMVGNGSVTVDYDAVRQELRRTNEASFQTRYVHRDDISKEHNHVRGKSSPALPAIEILKLVNCYMYQADAIENWKDTDAYNFAREIQVRAIQLLPGYAAAPWSI